ncbi:MAG: iron(III) transport system ATP-binding protein [Ulvibacter sp.]|jgi:ABC-type Fe3+/spermidine/putrescine transport system ATPase subunit
MLQVTIKSFSYSEKEILKNIVFKLEKGKHLAILGESGCGKSTLLHLIYGLLNLDKGSIYWDSRRLMGPKANLVPGEPFIKLVSQEFNLMPFISVAENIASHLSRMDAQLDDNRVDELLSVVDLKAFKGTLVKNLSGGQKQRVALAKALANKPELLLLDEPFSNIDTKRKNKLRRDLYEYLKLNNISCITATHDSEEALGFSDKILIIKEGTSLSQGIPSAVFQNISNEYEGGFFGDVTVLPSKLFRTDASSKVEILLPHQLFITEGKSKLTVNVKKAYFRGKDYLIQADWNGIEVFFENSEKLEKGAIVNLLKK